MHSGAMIVKSGRAPNHFPFIPTLFVLVLATWTPLATAVTVYDSVVTLSGSNQLEPNVFYGENLVPGTYDSTSDGSPAFSQMTGTHSISGVDSLGDPATMDLIYRGRATALSNGTLRSEATLTVNNGFYNPVLNDPFVIDTNFNTDPNGVPEQISLYSYASYRDTLFVTGAPGLDHIVVEIQLDGVLTDNLGGWGNITFLSLQQGFNQLYTENMAAVVNETIASDPFSIVGGEVQLDLQLNTEILIDLAQLEFLAFEGIDVSSLFGDVDFFNTLTLGVVSGFDVAGNPVNLTSAVTSSGHTFTTASAQSQGGSVAAPGVIALLGLGMLCMGRVRRVVR